jgi:hypothetical protein
MPDSLARSRHLLQAMPVISATVAEILQSRSLMFQIAAALSSAVKKPGKCANFGDKIRQLRCLTGSEVNPGTGELVGYHLWYVVSVIHFVETKERSVAIRLPFPSDVPNGSNTVFRLASPADMLCKFGWEIRQLTTSLRSPSQNPYETGLTAYRVFNCAVTGWHIAHWTWSCSDCALRVQMAARYGFSLVRQNRRNLERFCQAVTVECPELYICRRVANGKHVIVERPDTCVTAHLKRRGRESASHDLSSDDGGMSRAAEDVFHPAFSYWRRVLTEFGFLDGSQVSDDEGAD